MTDAEKLLQRMKQSKAGWGQDDLDRLYRGFGFQVKEGHSHRIYFHSKHLGLRATVARHRKLPIGYIQTAIRLIDELSKLEGE